MPKKFHHILKVYHKSISENKSIEIGLYRNSNLIGLSLGITTQKNQKNQKNHLEISFSITLFTLNFTFDFYDDRYFDNFDNFDNFIN